MGVSNFTNGFRQGVTIRGLPVANTHPGQIWWVNGSSVPAPGAISSSDGNDGSYLRPFRTITKAIASAKQNRGDMVMIMPGHTETVTTDGGIAFSKAGTAFIGLGAGTLRPTITLSTLAAAAITITAANVTISNFRVIANFADITNAIDLTGANCTLDRIEFSEAGADLNFLDYIVCSAGDGTSNNLTVTNCVGTAIDAGQNSFLRIVGDLDRLTFKDNYYCSTSANTLAMILCATGKDLTDCEITGNRMYTLATAGDLLIDNDTTANTGIVAYNYIGHADVSGEILVDADGVRQFENMGTATDTASGYILPAIDS